MLWGCAVVGIVYLLVNWVFVANLTPARASVVTESDDVTLVHVVAAQLVGPKGAMLTSACLVVVFVSTASALAFMGPRVYAEMAKDGLLPRAFAGRGEGRPPTSAVLLQGALCLALTFTHSLRGALENVGAVLVLFAGLTAASLFRTPRVLGSAPSWSARAGATVYAAGALWMLYYGLKGKAELWLWLAGLGLAGAISSALTRWRARSASAGVGRV
jgi:APA family basic amino acid/polyamine antiporter